MNLCPLALLLIFTAVVTSSDDQPLNKDQKETGSPLSLLSLSKISGQNTLCYRPVPPRGSTMMDFIDTCQPEGGSYPAAKVQCQCKRCDLKLELQCIDFTWYAESPTICNDNKKRCGSCRKVHKATDITCSSDDKRDGYLHEQRVCVCKNTGQNVTTRCSYVGWKVTDLQAYKKACGEASDYTSAPEVTTTITADVEVTMVSVLGDDVTDLPAMTTVQPEGHSEVTEGDSEVTEEPTESHPETTTTDSGTTQTTIREYDDEVYKIDVA